MSTDAQKRASARYNARNTVQLAIRLNKATDADVIARIMEAPSKAGYIKELVRADLRRERHAKPQHPVGDGPC